MLLAMATDDDFYVAVASTVSRLLMVMAVLGMDVLIVDIPSFYCLYFFYNSV